jgi:hypothetical protein
MKDDWRSKMWSLISQGRTLDAIVLVHEHTGDTLNDAKKYVEGLIDGWSHGRRDTIVCKDGVDAAILAIMERHELFEQ